MTRTVILANGNFPKSRMALRIIELATNIVCCDGAVDRLLVFGREPNLIIGDMDSIKESTLKKYKQICIQDNSEYTSDLMKALDWCKSNGIQEVNIVGATGKREDHAIGNIFMTLDYAASLNIKIYTDKGIFTPIIASQRFRSFPGQQVSLLATDSSTKITTKGLKYPLTNQSLERMWRGTLNESVSNEFEIELTHGSLLVFTTH